jgi:VWFA-related protein
MVAGGAMRAPLALAVVVAVAVGALGQEPDERRGVFPSRVELVTVDAVVIGDDGAPITGLGVADFTLSENGVRQEILAFEAVEQPAVAPPATPEATALPRASTSPGSAAARVRAFVVVFDELHLGAAEAVRARDAARVFLESLAAGDRVTLAATGDGSWWHARMPEGRAPLLAVLARLRGRIAPAEWPSEAMTEYEAMRIHRDRDPLVTGHVIRRWRSAATDVLSFREPDTLADRVASAAARVYLEAERRNRVTLDTLGRAFRSLRGVRGRKSVLLVSGGFVHDPRLAPLREALEQSRRANAALYFVDARGLSALDPDFTAEARSPTAIEDMPLALGAVAVAGGGSESLAADTGGFTVHRRNDLAGAVRAIARESSSYYLLGYAPPDGQRDGRFRRIVVEVARPGARVRARSGYYPSAEGATPATPASAVQQALDSPFDLDQVPLRAAVLVLGDLPRGEARVLLTTDVSAGALERQLAAGGAVRRLDYGIRVARDDSSADRRSDQQLVFREPASRGDADATAWLPITLEIPLAPGRYQARLAVRDAGSGRMGSLTRDFEVPSLGGLRISTPLLSERSGKPPEGPPITARRSFAPAGVLHCRFEVYGAAKDPASGRPAVSAGFAIRSAEGRLLAASPASALVPGGDGTLARTIGIPLAAAPPGRYEVLVLARDELSGRRAEVREPFVVEPDPDAR